MDITTERLFAKIGTLTVENEALRALVQQLTAERDELKKEQDKDPDAPDED